jgi:hypothetical protein
MRRYSPKKERKMAGFLTKEMTELLGGIPPGNFQPCAYYDKSLDCIRVQIRDCSFTEIRINQLFTIYQANHTKNGIEYVGFTVKGIRYWFEELKLPLPKQGPFILAEIINTLVKAIPAPTQTYTDIIATNFTEALTLEVGGLQEAA